MEQKYDVQQITVESILNDIKTGEIVIPELQRPFVWSNTQVRDLIDSLYNGYPIGYLITSKNSNLKRRNGGETIGKTMLIDGQQRITAIMTAMAGLEVLKQDFKKYRIIISFNPFADTNKGEKMFEVQSSAILRDKRWVADIADLFKADFSLISFYNEFRKINSDIIVNESELERSFNKLLGIKSQLIGVITLKAYLAVDDVTEIFVRINSQGAKLNQTDFVMSKLSANEEYGGNTVRKAIDYFSHLALCPEWYSDICKDADFMNTPYASKMKWLKDDKEEVYDPNYNDIIRTVFMYKFDRAKVKDLVSLIDGRDFETRTNKEEIKENTFNLMAEGVLDFMNEYTFTNFVLAVKSAGFVAKKLISSPIALDFAYQLYLRLNADPTIDKALLKHYVIKWFVLSMLTGRYSSSSETIMEQDIKRMKERGFACFLADVEAAELSDTFWNVGLLQSLETSVISSPYFNLFIAAQIFFGDDSLLQSGTKISDLITVIGDVHHIFPKKYLERNGYGQRTKYNQIANFTYLDTMVNKAVGDDAPKDYFSKVKEQCTGGVKAFGNIFDMDALKVNLKENCIPLEVMEMDYSQYDEFLAERRKLMAKKIKDYYYSL